MTRFRRYGAYLKARYGTTAYRVAVDAGFSCPNRSLDRSSGGCVYCDEFGSRAAYSRGLAPAPREREGLEAGEFTGDSGLSRELEESIRLQVERGRAFLEARYRARVFLLYFQAFSNTFAEPVKLRRVYDYGLSLAEFKELIIATRPDCIDPEVARLLGSYRTRDRDVWIELGLQSACNATLGRIGRGHTVEQFGRAFALLREVGVKISCHLIFGLPGESTADMMRSVDYLAALGPDGVKFHDLHIPFGTALFREYLGGELVVPSGERHLEYLASAIERLPPDVVVMRLTCDTPEANRAAPRRPIAKQSIYDRLEALLESRSTWQGRRFDRPATTRAR